MKITRVETILVKTPFRPGSAGAGGRMGLQSMETLFVRVETDEGVVGWGEAFGFKLSATTKTAIDTLIAPMCIGRDPQDLAPLMKDLHYRVHNYGRNGSVMFGLAGIDIALWDIAGKIAGLPLYRLLGAAPRTHLPCYASLWRYADTVEVTRNVEQALTRGYREIKLHEIDVAIIQAASKAAGPDIPLMLDVNCTWSASEAIEVTRRLKDLNVRWIEEPTWPPEDHAALAEVAKNGALPVAAGENVTSIAAFADMFRLGAVAYTQPSAAKIGVSAMVEVMALARTYNVRFAPHSPYFGPGLLATLHLAAAAGGEVPVERYYCDLDGSPYGEAVDAKDGRIALPQGPGLGIEVDEGILQRQRQ